MHKVVKIHMSCAACDKPALCELDLCVKCALTKSTESADPALNRLAAYGLAYQFGYGDAGDDAIARLIELHPCVEDAVQNMVMFRKLAEMAAPPATPPPESPPALPSPPESPPPAPAIPPALSAKLTELTTPAYLQPTCKYAYRVLSAEREALKGDPYASAIMNMKSMDSRLDNSWTRSAPYRLSGRKTTRVHYRCSFVPRTRYYRTWS